MYVLQQQQFGLELLLPIGGRLIYYTHNIFMFLFQITSGIHRWVGLKSGTCDCFNRIFDCSIRIYQFVANSWEDKAWEHLSSGLPLAMPAANGLYIIITSSSRQYFIVLNVLLEYIYTCAGMRTLTYTHACTYVRTHTCQ